MFEPALNMNRNVIVHSLICAALLATAPGFVAAQVRGSMIPPETLDVTLQRQDRMFDRLDTDRDGAITSVEIAATARNGSGQRGPTPGGRGAGMMARMFESADADTDGRITRDEMRVSATTRFREQDANSDGLVSSEERPAFPGGPGGGFAPPQAQDQMLPMADGSGD